MESHKVARCWCIVRAVENALSKAESESAFKRIAWLLKVGLRPDCGGGAWSALCSKGSSARLRSLGFPQPFVTTK